MSNRNTPEWLAAIKLFHWMLGIASLQWMEEAGKKVTAKLKELGYLEAHESRIDWKTSEYNFDARERKFALEGDLLEERMDLLDITFNRAYRLIPEARDVLDEYKKSL